MAQETRALRFSVRAVDKSDEFALSGRAITYNDETEIRCANGNSFIERIAPGALDGVLGGDAEIKALFNHNADSVLGSRKNKTLSLKSNERGLFFGIQLDKNNAKHQEVHAMCKRGDVDGCSFGFFPEDEKWDTVRDANGTLQARRTLTKINMWEMSVVTFPAYQNTVVQARSVDYSAAITRAKAAPEADAFLVAAKKKAQEIREQIFASADAFIFPPDWETNPNADVTPVFFTPEQRAAHEDAQLRARADEIGRQIFKDAVREEFGL